MNVVDVNSAHVCVYSVMKWEEPFDSAIYCLKSDGRHCLLVGTARHGMVRLWDMRRPRHVQVRTLLSHVLYITCI